MLCNEIQEQKSFERHYLNNYFEHKAFIHPELVKLCFMLSRNKHIVLITSFS